MSMALFPTQSAVLLSLVVSSKKSVEVAEMIETQEAPQVDSEALTAVPSGTWTWFDLTIKGAAIVVFLASFPELAWIVIKHMR